MKAVILAGGLGSRISEETHARPKPMVEIGGKPILWHIMKLYASQGINEFVVCCGYKGEIIKDYFINFYYKNSDVVVDMENKNINIIKSDALPWKIHLIDTGESTMTGGRIKRIKPYVEDSELFCLTYGDGLANINVKKLIQFHKSHGKQATLTAVHPPSRFGELELKNNQVVKFKEKPKNNQLINGGFFVLSPKVISRIKDDTSIWEHEPLTSLSQDGELMAYVHKEFWYPMDTLHDKNHLNNLWETGTAPWKMWE